MIMKAGLISGLRRLEFKEFERPEKAVPGAVIVAISKAGICGSDVSAYRTGTPWAPWLSGHEWAGTVVSVGDGVENVSVGDRVTRTVLPACGVCQLCRAGIHERCPAKSSLAAGTHPLTPLHGGFAERISVPGEMVLRVPDGVSDEQAAMAEPATVVVHAVRRRAPVLGDTVVVLGCGTLGLIALQLLRAAGALQVIAVDPIAHRRELAESLGADLAVAPGDDALSAVRDLTAGLGADLLYDCSGTENSMRSAAALARPGGAIMMVGSSLHSVSVEPAAWQTKQLIVDTSFMQLHHEFAITVDLLARGVLSTTGISERTVGLADLPSVFDELADGSDRVKILVDPRSVAGTARSS